MTELWYVVAFCGGIFSFETSTRLKSRDSHTCKQKKGRKIMRKIKRKKGYAEKRLQKHIHLHKVF